MSDDQGVGAMAHIEDSMLGIFVSQLETRAIWVEGRASTLDDAERRILEDVKRRIAGLRSEQGSTLKQHIAWTEAYSVERMLALLELADSLIPEIKRRLDEAAGEAVSATARMRDSLTLLEARAFNMTNSPPTLHLEIVPALRSLLLDVMEELHWTNTRKHHARPFQKRASNRVAIAAIVSFLMFILPYVVISVVFSTSTTFNLKTWSWLPLYSSLTAGLFGAFFSRIIYIQQNLNVLSIEETKSAGYFSSIMLRGCVGMCGALVVFFFLQSNIVSGNLFPNFSQVGISETDFPLKPDATDLPTTIKLILPSPALALLVIWCFLAGFSERLVPSILSTTEGTLGNAARSQAK